MTEFDIKPKIESRDTVMIEKLRCAGLRPTQQRLSLSAIMFAKGHRHMTAEQLYQEALDLGLTVSLATVYNTLHQFAEVGLIREINFEPMPCYFDTDTREHIHFFIEDKQEMIDIHIDEPLRDRLPEPPDGYEIVNASMVVRLRPKSRSDIPVPVHTK